MIGLGSTGPPSDTDGATLRAVTGSPARDQQVLVNGGCKLTLTLDVPMQSHHAVRVAIDIEVGHVPMTAPRGVGPAAGHQHPRRGRGGSCRAATGLQRRRMWKAIPVMGPGKRLYRLFWSAGACAPGLGGASVVAITGLWKPIRTAGTDQIAQCGTTERWRISNSSCWADLRGAILPIESTSGELLHRQKPPLTDLYQSRE